MDTKKTLFITLAETFIARNIFYTDFWNELTSTPNLHVVLLVKEDTQNHYEKKLGRENVTVIGINPTYRNRLSRLVQELSRNTIDTHTNLWEKMRAHKEGSSNFFETYLKRVYTKIFGHITPFKHFLRFLMKKADTSQALKDIYDKWKPDAVFSTSITNFEFDVPIANEASKRNIRLMVMPRSWDNFTSHGLLKIQPDILSVQNRYLKEMAYKYQAISKDTPIKIVGLPHYDIYKHTERMLLPRDEFFKSMGLDPNKKFAIYAAMGDYLFPHEGEVSAVLENIIEKGLVKEPLQIVFRAHPRFQSPLEKMKKLKHVMPDLVAKHIGKDMAGLDIDETETKHFINSLVHADVVITAGSTMAIDAISLGRPTICIAYDLNLKDIDYWHSVERFYDCYTHFEALIETKGVKVVRSDAELSDAINTYIDNPSHDKEKRQKLIDLMVAPFDGKSGSRLAAFVKNDLLNI